MYLTHLNVGNIQYCLTQLFWYSRKKNKIYREKNIRLIFTNNQLIKPEQNFM